MADGGLTIDRQVTRRGLERKEPADMTQAYLTRWGCWLRQGGAGAKGYAHATVEGRLRRDGTLIRGQGQAVRLDDDQVAELVDRVVARLRMDDTRWPLLMRAYYGSEQATHATAAAVLSEHFGVPVSAASVRGWLREAAATVRGELRAVGLA